MGRHILFYEGLLLFFLEPIQFLARAGVLPRQITREAYAQISSHFNWRSDWHSLYFVLAHEAAHNPMAHADEEILEGMRTQLQRLSSDARAHRKAIAEGRLSAGAKHYVGQSLLTFLSALERRRQKVAQEEQADAVASEILRRAGLRVDSGLVWLQRMAVFREPSSTGWWGTLNRVFCATHPEAEPRMSSLRWNIQCLQYQGRPCKKYVPYPIADRLRFIGSEFASIEQYLEETVAIAEGRVKPPADHSQTIEIIESRVI